MATDTLSSTSLQAETDAMSSSHRRRTLPMLETAKVMMVDDEPFLMEVVQAFLEEAGYANFLTTDDPTRALDMMRSYRPDVLLLDLIMPGKSGFDLLTDIRHEPAFLYTPVLVLTASSDSDSKLRALGLGATDFLSKPVDPSELRLRLRNALAFKAYQDQLAYYDSLTNLPNRQLFLEHLDWTLRMAQRQGTQCALLQLNLDRFKQINDSLGHEVGDALLQAVSRRLANALRETGPARRRDDGDDSVSLSRLTGDEFIVIISEITAPEEPAAIARRLLESLKSSFVLGKHEIFVTASIGVALYPFDGRKSAELMTNVDQATTQAKELGRNTFALCSEETNTHSNERIKLETALRKAVNSHALELHYQPKIESSTGRIVGAEALLRWTDADFGQVSPTVFIPLAEETGLIMLLGEEVLEKACKDAAEWRAAGYDLQISVNVSAMQFRRGHLPVAIQSALQASNLPARNLRIELTESLLMTNATTNMAMLQNIKDLGVTLSMDDFGTGYSSLSYLKQFPLDELKIDRLFVSGLPDDKGNAAIVGAVIAMAHGLGLTVTAEGVETEAQQDFLSSHGCDQYQGFLFSRPISRHAFSALLKEHKVFNRSDIEAEMDSAS